MCNYEITKMNNNVETNVKRKDWFIARKTCAT